jgi:hypothetical protein
MLPAYIHTDTSLFSVTTFPSEQTSHNWAPPKYKSGTSLLELQDSVTKQLKNQTI